MKKLKIKHVLQIVLAIVIILGIVWRLQANKINNQKEAQMANLKANAIPVKVDTVKCSDFVQNIEVSGPVKNKTDLMLFPETQGRIIKIFKDKGDWVNKGDKIVQVDNSVLQEQYQLAKTNYQMSKLDYERMKNLVANDAVTKKNLEDIELKYTKSKADLAQTARMLENTTITAPVSGYINDTYYEQGMLISGSVKLCNIISKNKLTIDAEVNGSDLSMVNKGDVVGLKVDEYPNNEFSGRITDIAQKATSNSRFTIEVTIDENDLLKAGMFATVTIDKTLNNVILISRNAISGSLQNASVFVVKHNTLVEQPIQISRSFGDQVEVTNGLVPGEVFVSSGVINLYDSAKVQIIN